METQRLAGVIAIEIHFGKLGSTISERMPLVIFLLIKALNGNLVRL